MTPGETGQPRPQKADMRRSTGSETADLVSEVLKDAAHREEVRSRKQQPMGGNRQRILAVSLPLAGAFSFYLWFGQPSWVTPTLPDPITAQSADAGLRVAMYYQAREIEDFRAQNGRLPETLQELGGPPPPEMTYQRIDAATYQLVGQSRGVTLTFLSNEPLQQFVGDAMTRLGLGQAS
jgi:hypothetical protein